MSACIVRMRWELCGSRWQLRQFLVTPDFPPSPELRPDGWICDSLHDLPSLQHLPRPHNLHDLMLLSGKDAAAPPEFRFLSRWSNTIAGLHGLQIDPLQLLFAQADRQPAQLNGQVFVVGAGHRSLILHLDPADDWVVKISSTGASQQELAMHAAIDGLSCPFLRRLKPDFCGIVEGAGHGLRFLGLQPFAASSLRRYHCTAPASIEKFAEQVRGTRIINCLQPAAESHSQTCHPLLCP